MPGYVDRLIVRFGLDPSGNFLGVGYPNIGGGRSGEILPSLAGTWTTGGVDTRPNAVTFDASSKPVKFPQRVLSAGPVTAIAIANDSPIDSVDMVVNTAGETERHRISTGAPYLGTIDDTAIVHFVPGGSMPLLTRPVAIDAAGAQSARFDLTTCFWDCMFAAPSATATSGQLAVPVRLNVYRGIYPDAAAPRGPYEARLSWEIQDVGGAVPSQPALMVITAGRKRVRVSANVSQKNVGAASLRVDAGFGRKTASDHAAIKSDGLDLVSWDNLVAGVVMAPTADENITIFDYIGNPYYVFCASITGGAIGQRGHIEVQAWDDI